MKNQNTDEVVNSTPMPSLLVSGSEDSDNEERLAKREEIRRQLMISPKIGSMDSLNEDSTDGQSLKRKRYDVRRSGSDDFLLGFDEESGEAELQKENEASEEKVQQSPKLQNKKDNGKSPQHKSKKRKEVCF